MTQLKTLKDIERKIPTGDNVGGMKEYTIMIHAGELKSEAIKWVKAYPKFPLILECPVDETIDTSYKNIIRFIKHFCNLTEEDLK